MSVGKEPPKDVFASIPVPNQLRTQGGTHNDRPQGEKRISEKKIGELRFPLVDEMDTGSPRDESDISERTRTELLATLQANDHVVNKFKPQCPVFPPLPSSCIFPHRGHHAHRYRDVRWKILDYALKFKKKNPGKKIAWGATTSVFIISEQRFASSTEQQSKLDKPNVDTQVRRQQTAGKKTR